MKLWFDEYGCPVNPNYCSFGIIEAVVSIVSAVTGALGAAGSAIGGAAASGLGALGVGADTAGLIGGAIGDFIPGAIEGAGLGTVESAITGQPLLKGAEGGAITGGILGAGAPLLEAAGAGTTAADVLAGAGGGALAGKATGGSPLSGALSGAVSGGIASALGTPGQPGSTSGAPTGGGATGAGAQAAPASVAATAPASGDVTIPTANAPTPSGVDAGALQTSLPNLSTAPGSAAPAPSTGGGSGTSATPAVTSTNTVPTDQSGAVPWLNRNASWLLPAGALAYNAIRGNQQLPEQKQLTAAAASEAANARTLQSYIQNGTLPEGLQAGIDQATNAAIASVRSQYAAIGDSGSSAEQQDIDAVQLRAKTEGAQIALGLLQQGISEQGMADQLYADLLNASMSQDNNLATSFGNFATALVGATPAKAA